MTRLEVLKDALIMAEHSKYCFSENGRRPKENYLKEYDDESRKVEILKQTTMRPY